MPKWGGQYGDQNGMWRGGRSIASNGYVLVRVGKHHHLSDCRGYAYEHRIVAEEKIGRRLLPGEQVHHADGDRQNNSEENIIVVQSIAEHRNIEGKRNTSRRVKGEPNPTIECACGCGMLIAAFDLYNRLRRFITGHNMRLQNG